MGQEVERPAHCKREATAKAAAQHRLYQQIEMLDPGDEAIFKLFLERYKGSPPPNVVAALLLWLTRAMVHPGGSMLLWLKKLRKKMSNRM